MASVKSIDIVIPVCNEDKFVEQKVTQLASYLSEFTDYNWRIVVADNGSNDNTPEAGRRIAAQNKRIEYHRLEIKGRGYALRQMFLRSTADVVAYMDVDLSTNIRYLRLFFEGVNCGYDAVVGSRLMQASRTRRRFCREVISRCYNLMIKMLFWNRFSDAQCGFKAFRTERIKELLPYVKNNNWFFDTEILLLLEYNGFRIFEIPVEWIDDLTSTVNIAKTVLEDILGMIRMRLTLHKNKIGK